MMATIARGGEKRQVKIAEQIEYKNGTTLVKFKDQKLKGETIDKYTAQRLQKCHGGWWNLLPERAEGFRIFRIL